MYLLCTENITSLAQVIIINVFHMCVCVCVDEVDRARSEERQPAERKQSGGRGGDGGQLTVQRQRDRYLSVSTPVCTPVCLST